MELLKKKTTWVGIVLILKGLIEAFFVGGDTGTEFVWPGIGAIFGADVIAGAAIIAGRDALRKLEK
jgi:hypothetical protein